MSITVFLADDHRILREGLKILLEQQGDICVIGEAENGREAFEIILQKQPEIVLMDITMPELNGIDATQKLLAKLPGLKVIILSVHSDSEHVYRAFQAGAKGYLLKEAAGAEVADAVRAVHNGEHFLSNTIAETVLQEYTRMRQSRTTPLEQLSTREREVLQLTVEGKPSAEIAEILGLSPKTVETYRSRIMTKLSVNNITELVRFAVKYGLISLE
jgi:RNA polymerase sigma factor (sigma-70 family)